MVKVDLYGRAGNQMFQFSYARLVALKNHLNLVTEWPAGGLVEATTPAEGRGVIGVYRDIHDGEELPENIDYPVYLHGYFQDVNVFNIYKKEIKSFWKPEPIKAINHDDIVIHLRLTDYWSQRVNSVIRPDWYQMILSKERYNKLYIVVEPHCTNEKYLSNFKHYSPTIVSGTPKSDFNFLRSFDRIVCSNSTFAWWAAYLSEASKIYTFKRWMKGLNLAHMDGATVIDGAYWRDRSLERLDWDNYWEKPESYFRRGR